MRAFRAKSQGRYGKRHKPGEMNKTEQEYAEILEAKRLSGEIAAWWFEAITFKLAGDSRYTGDFAVLHVDGTMEIVNVKGPGPEDPNSLTKIRNAADKFFPFVFTREKKQSKKDGGNWVRTEF